jgi:hypothetical protein
MLNQQGANALTVKRFSFQLGETDCLLGGTALAEPA